MGKELSKCAKRILCLLIIGTLSQNQSALAADDETRVVVAMRELHLDDNFKFFVLDLSIKTEVFAFALKTMGEKVAMQELEDQVDRVVPHYQEQWNSNMVVAIRASMSVDDLEAAVKDGEGSAARSKLMSLEPVIGSKMEASSSDLLKKAVGEVLGAFLEKLRAEAPAP